MEKVIAVIIIFTFYTKLIININSVETYLLNDT